MPGRGNLQLARIFGIRVGAGASWLFVLFFLIYWLSGRFHEIIGGSETTAYAIAVAGALGYFLSLVLHELGHALAARRAGIPVVGIDLWFFGGMLHMRRQPQSASEEFTVAVAGPLVTLALFVFSIALGVVFASGSRFSDAVLIREGATTTPALALVGWLAFINGALLVFNLVPAFPLDGGRIARAIVWWRTGDRNRATLVTGRAGQAFALLLGLLGLLGLFSKEPFLGVLTLLLAFFLHQAAAQAVVQGELAKRIEHITVGDIMDREPVTIPAEATLLDAQEAVLPALPLAVVRGRGRGTPFPRRRARAAGLGGDRRRPPGAGGGGRPGVRHARADRPPGAPGIAARRPRGWASWERWWRSTARVFCRASSRSPTFARRCGPPIRRAEKGPPPAR